MGPVTGYLLAQACLAAAWFVSSNPAVDGALFLGGVFATFVFAATALIRRRFIAAFAVVTVGLALLASSHFLIRQSRSLADLEFDRMITSGAACTLRDIVAVDPAWKLKIDGFHARALDFHGATSELLFVTAFGEPELRLWGIGGEMRLTRLGRECPPATR